MADKETYTSGQVLRHFVGRGMPEAADQYKLLLKILSEGWLTHPPNNPKQSGNVIVNLQASLVNNGMYIPQVVCFCDIPWEHLSLHTSKYSMFGIGLRRGMLIDKGAAPAIYIPRARSCFRRMPDQDDIPQEILRQLNESLSYKQMNLTPHIGPPAEHYDRLARSFEEVAHYLRTSLSSSDGILLQDKAEAFIGFLRRRFLAFIKVFDDELPTDDPDNFYMEREWRVVGNVQFNPEDVAEVIVPDGYRDNVIRDLPAYTERVRVLE